MNNAIDIQRQLLERTHGIQQIMSLIPIFLRHPLYQLKSRDGYHEWNMLVSSQLNQLGYDLDKYFLTGDLSIPREIDSNDPVVQNLVDVLENAMLKVVHASIDPTLRTRYALKTQASGAELLKHIRADCENVTNREIAQLLQNLCRWTSVGCDTSDTKVRSSLRKLVLLSNRDPFVDKLAGIMFTLMMKNKVAEFRVLDANIDSTLSSAMREVRDLESSVKTVPSDKY
ncbi:hypothetical protein CANINC_004786 [Pichia inconspicua]|uniref:Uncharacterized protein n=1 Tax=Pichia inconspicua TaxID=52247 RepID=A0A4T0WVL3_9ASCO|nr:hypothetical protein CANINC_004786 [[Candida] inconspicua]